MPLYTKANARLKGMIESRKGDQVRDLDTSMMGRASFAQLDGRERERHNEVNGWRRGRVASVRLLFHSVGSVVELPIHDSIYRGGS